MRMCLFAPNEAVTEKKLAKAVCDMAAEKHQSNGMLQGAFHAKIRPLWRLGGRCDFYRHTRGAGVG